MLKDSLTSLRVLDFSHVVAGPVCGMLLGDLGADVVKIESLDGEMGRKIGPPWLHGESVVVLSVNRNKQGLAIDLKSPEGRKVAQTLSATADVIIESFRPGVMRRLGLDFDSMHVINPRLTYCSISAYGQTGPWSERPGVDGIIQAVTGLMSTLGGPQSEPAKVSIPVADMVTGYLATVAVLAALHKVREGHAGQHLDVSLYSSTLMLQQVGMAFYLATGKEPEKMGSAAPYAAPNEAFPTEDGWIMVAAYQSDRWRSLCNVLGVPTLLDDVRFSSNELRVANRDELNELLGAAFKLRSTASWLASLETADILCGPIASYQEVTASEQYRHSGIETSVMHPIAGVVRMPGFPLGAQCRGMPPSTPSPLLGQHSVEVLRRYGVSDEEIERLLRNGVVKSCT